MGSLQVRAVCLRKHQRGRTFVMQLTTVREIYKNREQYMNQEVTVGGWVRSVRGSKAFGFIVLHDGTYFETLHSGLLLHRHL